MDGLQVTPGSDWRSWYFGHCAAASCFVVLHSQAWLQSAACQEELAYALAEGKPVEAICVDKTPSVDGMPDTLPGEATGGFERAFFENLRVLIEIILQHLPATRAPLAYLLCAEPEALEFAQMLQMSLDEAGVHAVVHHPDSASGTTSSPDQSSHNIPLRHCPHAASVRGRCNEKDVESDAPAPQAVIMSELDPSAVLAQLQVASGAG